MFNKKLGLVLVAALSLSMFFTGCSGKEDKAANTEKSAMVVNEDAVSVVEEGVNAYFANMPDHIYKIGQKDFLDKVAAGEDMFILDIRTAEDYAKGHVKGAYNSPWGPAIAENLSKMPSDKPVYVYCYSGQTAGQAVMTLNLAGFDARSVNLGMNFGISKVEGFEPDTEAVEFGGDITTIDGEVQEALTAYYAGLADVKETTFKNYKVSEDNLKSMLDGKEDFYLLSIRSAEDFGKAHIDGASNIPWGAGMEKSFDTLPTDKKIVVYCYSGQTAGQTVAGLKLLGYDAVSLNGGLGVGANAPIGWTNKGFDVVQ